MVDNIGRGLLSEDRRAREAAARYREWAESLDEGELFRYVRERTGGLGHGKKGFEVGKMGLKGYVIAWPERARGMVLEIGTGLGRTTWALLRWGDPKLVVSVEIDPRMLAIALYRNPVSEFSEALRDDRVKILLGDAVEVVPELPKGFDHVVHDGGPCPGRNPRLFSPEFLRTMTEKLKDNGTASVFAGRDPRWQDRIYRALSRLFLEVRAESFPDTPTVVFRCKGRR
ncbi:spermidine synthase [Methanopyrus sp.]